MNEQMQKFKNAISRMVRSDWFIVFNSVLIMLGWVLDIWVPMLCVIVALNTLPLFFVKSTKHIMCVLMMFSFIMNTDRNDLLRYAPVLALVGVLVIGMIFNAVYFKRNFKVLHPKNIKGFHASLLALVFPMALAGVGSPAEVPLFSVALFALTLIVGIIYSFFTISYCDSEDKEGLPEYILKILVASGIVVSLEMLIFYARIGDINGIVHAMMEKSVHIGWAGPNNMAPLLSLAIPATLYFCIRKNFATPLFATLALVEYALIISTGCRGTILFTTIAMPAMLLYVIVKSENKVSFGVTVSIVFLIAVVLIAYYGNIFANIVTTILNKRLESVGREELYQLAVDTFKTWPIFGAGWDYKTDLYYHSTFFQILATMGIFGLIIFAVFYFWRYWTFFRMRKDPAVVALLCGSVLFEAYGMIDTNYFLPNFFLILLFMTFAVEIDLPEDACLAFGGKDPVAHVIGFFRILADKVRPPKQHPIDSATEMTSQTGDTSQREDIASTETPTSAPLPDTTTENSTDTTSETSTDISTENSSNTPGDTLPYGQGPDEQASAPSEKSEPSYNNVKDNDVKSDEK